MPAAIADCGFTDWAVRPPEVLPAPLRYDQDIADAELVLDAVVVLGDLVTWELPDTLWPKAEAALGRLASALDDDDPKAFARALGDLEYLSEQRTETSLGDEPTDPAPPTVRERSVELVDRLVSSGGAAASDGAPKTGKTGRTGKADGRKADTGGRADRGGGRRSGR